MLDKLDLLQFLLTKNYFPPHQEFSSCKPDVETRSPLIEILSNCTPFTKEMSPAH